jgi:hypothetical protein
MKIANHVETFVEYLSFSESHFMKGHFSNALKSKYYKIFSVSVLQ